MLEFLPGISWETYVLPNPAPQKNQLRNQKGWGFPGGAVVKHLPSNAGDTGSSPGPGRSHMPRSN